MGDNNQNQNQVQENNNAAGTGTATEQAQFDYNKFEEIMTKVMSKREDSVAKSILKDNGIDGDDLKDFLATYKAQKEAKANSANQELENLRKENEAYKARERENNINSVINTTAKTIGIDADRLAMMKFDTSEAVDQDGKVDAEKIKTLLEALAIKAPWLKVDSTNTSTSGFKPGNASGQSEKKTEDGLDEETREAARLLGLKLEK